MIPHFMSSPRLSPLFVVRCTLADANNLIALFNLDNYHIFILKNVFIINLLQDDSRFNNWMPESLSFVYVRVWELCVNDWAHAYFTIHTIYLLVAHTHTHIYEK